MITWALLACSGVRPAGVAVGLVIVAVHPYPPPPPPNIAATTPPAVTVRSRMTARNPATPAVITRPTGRPRRDGPREDRPGAPAARGGRATATPPRPARRP